MIMEGFTNYINYLDGFYVLARSEEECRRAQWALVKILRLIDWWFP